MASRITVRLVILICFLFAAACGLLAFGQFLQWKMERDDLVQVNGTISAVKETFENNSRRLDSTKTLFIRMNENPLSFRLIGTYPYDHFLGSLQKGDSVKIGIRPVWMQYTGFGRKEDIYLIEKNGELLFHPNETKENTIGTMLASLSGMIIFLLFPIYIFRKIPDGY